MYYLQSRYYNPEWGRFINADEIAAVTGELLSANMFVYCKSNTVNMKDITGFRSTPVFGDDGNEVGEWDDMQEELHEENATNKMRGRDAHRSEQKSWDYHHGKKGIKS